LGDFGEVFAAGTSEATRQKIEKLVYARPL
jgi:hypothetical protein